MPKKLLRKAEEDIKREERFIFHRFIYLKNHHQIFFGLILLYLSHRMIIVLTGKE